ncbi:MAG TPA: hypothetical protein PLD27_07695 [bacterium]|nr:hypothetical protein [bacterium]HOL47807.1 hypothetical protein [bacterium]HPQ19085.1 hypothetical protein [bacterium]
MKIIFYLFCFFIILSINLAAQSNIELSKKWFDEAIKSNDISEKIKLLKRAIILDENNYKALQELGLLYIQSGDIINGENYLKTASEIYTKQTKSEEINVGVMEKRNFKIEKIGGCIDIYKISDEVNQEIKEAKKEEAQQKEKFFAYLYLKEKSKNSNEYFLTITNLQFKKLILKEIALNKENTNNISGWTILKILKGNMEEYNGEQKNITINPYDTLVLHIKATKLKEEDTKLTFSLSIEDEEGQKISKLLSNI